MKKGSVDEIAGREVKEPLKIKFSCPIMFFVIVFQIIIKKEKPPRKKR